MVMPHADAVSERELSPRLSVPSRNFPISANILMEDNKQLSKSGRRDNPCAMPITTLLSRCTRGPPKEGIRGNTLHPQDKYLLEAGNVPCRLFTLHLCTLTPRADDPHPYHQRYLEEWFPGRLSRRSSRRSHSSVSAWYRYRSTGILKVSQSYN